MKMRIFAFVAVVCSWLSHSYAMEIEGDFSLTAHGNLYIQFLTNVGKENGAEALLTDEYLALLFANDFRKAECGTTVAYDIKELRKHLLSLKEKLKKWEIIQVLFNIPAKENNAVTLQFLWKASEGAKEWHTTMAILWFDKDGKIRRIHEVYNVYQGKPLDTP
jgi:hypothetical protein